MENRDLLVLNFNNFSAKSVVVKEKGQLRLLKINENNREENGFGATLIDCEYKEGDIVNFYGDSSVTIIDSKIDNCILSGCKISYCKINNTRIIGKYNSIADSTIEKCNLRNVEVSSSRLANSIISYGTMRAAKVDGIHSTSSTVARSEVRDLTVKDTYIADSIIHGHNLSYADSDIRGCEFTGEITIIECTFDSCKATENQTFSFATAKDVDFDTNIRESIRCQTGLGVIGNYVIAYKQVQPDLVSFYDVNFKYEIGKVVEAEVPEESMNSSSCGPGLHFSNATYWNDSVKYSESITIAAKIMLKDIITVQSGKIRCKKAEILDVVSTVA